ncbi:MAG: FAD-dependent oxidoreductase [Pseudomonadota bacterium]
MTQTTVIGAGVVGLCVAHALADRGCTVTVVAPSGGPHAGACSWWAGGMLAPGCEAESAEPLIGALAADGIAFWQACGEAEMRGTLVVAHPRDEAELRRFAAATEGHRRLEASEIAGLEPTIGARFPAGFLFPEEGQIDPRGALSRLAVDLRARGVRFEAREAVADDRKGLCVDARGLAARDVLPDLRGVRGEMAMIRAPEVEITRTVRLLHPRWPLYLVPRGEGVYMIGATQIESERQGGATVRSVLDLLGALYALHPAFAEAEVLELGAGLRPAFPDNLPRLRWRSGALSVNGLFRHGFLCAPALARMAAEHLLDGRWFPEVMDEDRAERQSA